MYLRLISILRVPVLYPPTRFIGVSSSIIENLWSGGIHGIDEWIFFTNLRISFCSDIFIPSRSVFLKYTPSSSSGVGFISFRVVTHRQLKPCGAIGVSVPEKFWSSGIHPSISLSGRNLIWFIKDYPLFSPFSIYKSRNLIWFIKSKNKVYKPKDTNISQRGEIWLSAYIREKLSFRKKLRLRFARYFDKKYKDFHLFLQKGLISTKTNM